MKILFLLHSANSTDGSSIAVMSIITKLSQMNHEIMVISGQDGTFLTELQQKGIKTRVVEYYGAMYPSVSSFKSLFALPYHLIKRIYVNHLAEKSIQKIVDDFKPNVIHTNVGVVRVGYYVARKKGIPHVWHIRETSNGLSLRHYPFDLWQRYLYHSNDFNIAITDVVSNFYKLKKNNTSVVYDGVFSSNYILNHQKPKNNYFLFVGRVSQAKGADWAIDSFLKIAPSFKDVELWLAGSDISAFASELKSSVAKTAFADRIKFLGARSDVYALMAGAQAVLVPSVLEGFGFITVESMLNRTLVIGRNTGGTQEQFDNGLRLLGNEIGLRCNSVDDMAMHMTNVCRYGQSHYKAMIDSAEHVVRELYTIENNISSIVKIYNKVLCKYQKKNIV